MKYKGFILITGRGRGLDLELKKQIKALLSIALAALMLSTFVWHFEQYSLREADTLPCQTECEAGPGLLISTYGQSE